MKALFLTAILAVSFSSFSAFSVESKEGSEICFNDSRSKGKEIKSEEQAKEVKSDIVISE